VLHFKKKSIDQREHVVEELGEPDGLLRRKETCIVGKVFEEFGFGVSVPDPVVSLAGNFFGFEDDSDVVLRKLDGLHADEIQADVRVGDFVDSELHACVGLCEVTGLL